MSVRRSALASYTTQIYISFIGVLMMPFYLRHLGAEGYGLVGVFVAMQAWFQALDFGLPSIVTRQVARWRGGAESVNNVTSSLRALECTFALVAALVLAMLMGSSEYVAEHWLKPQHLSNQVVHQALMLASLACALRWASGLYRGVVVGLEQIERLSLMSAIFATLRFVVVIPLIAQASDPVGAFFWFQLIIAALEVLALALMAYSGLTSSWVALMVRPTWAALRRGDRLAAHMALATLVWLVATQTDKVLLSRLLSLSEFGYFSMATALAGGLLLITAPIGQTLMPHLSRLEASGDESELRRMYSMATQGACIVVSSLTAVLLACAGPILWAWTGNRDLAAQVAPVLVPYAVGNGFLALGALPYYLQFARGDLRLHNVGTGLLVAALIPALYFVAPRFGAVGAGFVWAGVMAIYFLFWSPIVHKRCLARGGRSWLLRDVAPILISTMLISFAVTLSVPMWPLGRLWQLGCVSVALTVIGIGACLASSFARHQLSRLFRVAMPVAHK